MYDHPRSAMFFAVSGVALLGLTTSVLAQNASITASGFSQHWGTSNADYDLNGDGVVNGADLAMFLQAESSGASGQSTTSSAGGGEGMGIAPAGTETPGAASVAAAGPSAPNFMRNAAGTEGARIYPGSGFAGPTSVPEQVGDANVTGGTAKAIARWDFIPYRTITSPTNIAVTAFHIGGIDRVSFSANGGAWVDVREMKRNPQTGVWEYFVTLDPADFEDGKIEIRAIAWPANGRPRALQGTIDGRERLGEYSMIVWNNRGGSLAAAERWVSPQGSDSNDGRSASTPMKTIAKAAAAIQAAHGGDAGGGFVNLLPGEYSWSGARKDEFGATLPQPLTADRWITVRSAPDATGAVVFRSDDASGALPATKLAVHGVKFVGARLARSGAADAVLWISNCDFEGLGTLDNPQWIDTSYAGAFATQTSFRNCAQGPDRGLLFRDVHLVNLGWDAFVGPRLMLNSTVQGIVRPEGQTWHCDILQYGQTQPDDPNENVIVYGFQALDCRSQGFFARAMSVAGATTWRDFAFVNCFMEFAQGSTHTSQWMVSVDHLLILNSGFVGGTTMIRARDYERLLVYTNVLMTNTVFTRIAVSGDISASLRARSNHFINGPTFGAPASAGDPRFVGAAQNDYRPAIGSPLREQVGNPTLRVDAALDVVSVPASIGPYCE